LIAGIRYYYSFQASNAAGLTKSNIMTNVLTLMPVIISNKNTATTIDSAKLHTVQLQLKLMAHHLQSQIMQIMKLPQLLLG
jgi:hypothetical protein